MIVTLIQAFSMNYDDESAGPAGTGKTEIAKTLSVRFWIGAIIFFY